MEKPMQEIAGLVKNIAEQNYIAGIKLGYKYALKGMSLEEILEVQKKHWVERLGGV